LGTCRQGRPGHRASLHCRPQHVQQAVGWHSVLCHGEHILSHGSVGAHCALTYCSAAVVQYLHSMTPELFSPGVASTLSINFVALLWQLVGSLGTGRRGHRGSVSASGIIACIMGTWLAQRARSQHVFAPLGPYGPQAGFLHSVFWQRTSSRVGPWVHSWQ